MKDFPWADKENPKRVNFNAKLLGLIAEEITKCWFRNEKCPYENFGRPTIKWIENGKIRKATLDFLIKEKKSDLEEKYYLVEQKSLFAKNNGNLRIFQDSKRFIKAYKAWDKSKTKRTGAWRIFKKFNDHDVISVYFKNSKNLKNRIIGSKLIWSDVRISNESKFLEELRRETSIKEIFGLTTIIEDLKNWKDKDYQTLIQSRRKWMSEVFNHLK